jgi:hypothetical protein
MSLIYLDSIIKQMEYYQHLGSTTIEKLNFEALCWQYNEESNSIAVIVKHLAGNMLSRWTDFLTTDGEKENRNRDEEFVNNFKDKSSILDTWHEGWSCFMDALILSKQHDLNRIIYIRNEAHSIMEAINRQITHYAYHIGQIVYLGKMISGKDWQSLSIPKNQSLQYNTEMFAQQASIQHNTKSSVNHKNKQ